MFPVPAYLTPKQQKKPMGKKRTQCGQRVQLTVGWVWGERRDYRSREVGRGITERGRWPCREHSLSRSEELGGGEQL